MTSARFVSTSRRQPVSRVAAASPVLRTASSATAYATLTATGRASTFAVATRRARVGAGREDPCDQRERDQHEQRPLPEGTARRRSSPAAAPGRVRRSPRRRWRAANSTHSPMDSWTASTWVPADHHSPGSSRRGDRARRASGTSRRVRSPKTSRRASAQATRDPTASSVSTTAAQPWPSGSTAVSSQVSRLLARHEVAGVVLEHVGEEAGRLRPLEVHPVVGEPRPARRREAPPRGGRHDEDEQPDPEPAEARLSGTRGTVRATSTHGNSIVSVGAGAGPRHRRTVCTDGAGRSTRG